ncbi:MAG: CRISPR-associated endonuclease Cas2 [Ferruginibacter sp.]
MKSLHELLKKKKRHGMETNFGRDSANFDGIEDLDKRVAAIEKHLSQYIRKSNADTMLFFIMYDIEDNKVRTHISKYLKKHGCTRLQKSVFIGNGSIKLYKEIGDTLREVNALYDNGDSIMVLPVSKESMVQLNVIGKDLDYKMVVSPPNVLII